MNLLIAGDTVPKENNIDLFRQKKIEKIMGEELNSIWNNANYKILNLEAPVTAYGQGINKCGPNLKIDPEAIHGIKQLDPTVLLLANNHIMDYGEQGLKDTLKVLNNNHIEYIGAEIKKEKISKSYTIDTKENKIGIYNCCDIEFSVASENNPGAYGIDFFNIWEEIKDLKEKNDYVIIIYHGGKEHYRYPSPNLQKMCRKMIDYGADLIVCQHSHCIGCYENYKEKTIIYGQGNFIFDGQDNEYWNTSLLIDINLSDEFKINYIPICKTNYGTRLANKKEKEKILEEFENRSKEIKIDKFVEKNYKKFSEAYFDSYLHICHGDNLLYRIINKVFFHRITKKLYSKRCITALLNIIECDAHRELFIEGIKTKLDFMGDKNE